MRRNLFGLFKPLLLSFILIIFFTAPASAEPQKQWTDLTTAAAANGSTVTTRVFGYYADVEGFGQVFVICNPNTGEETGDAFIPNAKVGEKQAQKIVRYDRKYDIDWDHPKQVNPVRVSLIAPNIPTDTRYDVEYYRQTGQLKRKTENQFAWPMSYSFARMIPGSDPNYWLIVALVENPNPFPVKADVTTSIRSWTSGWQSEGIYFNRTVPLGPNETKYIILNTGQKKEFLLDEWGDWPSPGYSLAYYNARINEINSPDYPDTLKSDGEYGFFTTYVRWDGTNPTVYPLFPMRLAFNFTCWSYDSYGSYWYGYYRGREFPQCYGHAEYDPKTGQWSITVSFGYFEKPWYMSDDEWQKIYNTAVDKAVSALKSLFEKWYPKVPLHSSWSKDNLKVDGDTGYYTSSRNETWPDGRRPSFVITFDHLEPVPPKKCPAGSRF